MEILQPKLRFPEFKENWEIEALEEYIDLFSGIALKSEEISEDNNGTPILRGINITEGSIRHTKEIDRYYLGNVDKLQKYFVKEDDLVLGMDGSKVGKNVALIKKDDENAILIQRVARLRSNSKSNIRYIYQQVFSKKFHDYVDIVNTSSGIPHISSQQIKDFKIGFPSLEEQTKIANFLSSVDEKLNLLKEKKTLLEDYKKGIMQKIFNQEIRFKDDNGNDFEDWEEVKLSDFAEVNKGNQLNKDDLNDFETYPCISGGIEPSGYTNKYNREENTIIISEGGNSCGYVNFVKTKFWCGGHCYSIDLLNNFSKTFVYQLLKFYQDEIMRLRVGSGLPNIQKKDLKNLIVNLPSSLGEQTKITNFLSAIDGKIELVSNQIQDTQEYKKGLLQQMFV
ncbi:restriction endonuclease subunit S [Flavobacterium macrobrachii]|uniref:Restriction endonuclease subunit S n=1 Tax=Flavobacterium macrobrachii TaxID=591204 RepID=A0ABS2CTT8_9FLAO|nr:restriction endonuclease subunit S [Flavobacterium macrobrachii]MBM6498392.1 restriction endonuclease subunit S [Flavobacterium macrobrachii]